MEEELRKSGILYLQQQKFGKKWKKVWALAYGDSGCSVSRMELFECRDDAERTELKRSKHDSRKVVRMSHFLRVAEKKGAACPRDHGAFLVETTERNFLFAAELSELGDWVRTLCDIAFPKMSPGESAASLTPGVRDSGMVENAIYCSSSELKEYHVMVKRTDASVRCKLDGAFTLRVGFKALHLQDPKSRAISFSWPYQHIRKFGLNKLCFIFEAGRMSSSGEGLFQFQTRQNYKIFQAVDRAINLQAQGDGRPASSPDSGPAPGPVTADDDDVDDLYSKVNKVRRPRPEPDPLFASVGELALDDHASLRGRGGKMTGRPLPRPAPDPERSPVAGPEPPSPTPESEYEEVGEKSPYHNIELVDGLVLIADGLAEDPVAQDCPCDAGDGFPRVPKPRVRMLSNPCYDHREADAGPGTHARSRSENSDQPCQN